MGGGLRTDDVVQKIMEFNVKEATKAVIPFFSRGYSIISC